MTGFAPALFGSMAADPWSHTRPTAMGGIEVK